MRRISAPVDSDRAIELARAGFGQRRKMLRRSLASMLDDPVAALQAAAIPATSRAEELSTGDYLRLAETT
jgi:16S rRNA (adenine1518-N6/adenine1519-N6)-dimethyltransferase